MASSTGKEKNAHFWINTTAPRTHTCTHAHTRAHTQRRPAAQLRFIGSKVGFSVHRLRKESIYFPFWPFQHQFFFCKMVNTSTKWTRDTSHKDGLPGVQRLRSIHHKITVVQVPGADLDLSHMHIKTQVLAAHTIYSRLLIKVTLKVKAVSPLRHCVYVCICVRVCIRVRVCVCVLPLTGLSLMVGLDTQR